MHKKVLYVPLITSFFLCSETSGGGGGLVTKSCKILATPWTVACQAPLSTRFPWQKGWSGLPFPSPGDLPHPEIKLEPPALQVDSLPGGLEGRGQTVAYWGYPRLFVQIWGRGG